jgi:hypothetical protein
MGEFLFLLVVEIVRGKKKIVGDLLQSTNYQSINLTTRKY